jgi:hypothetical protein
VVTVRSVGANGRATTEDGLDVVAVDGAGDEDGLTAAGPPPVAPCCGVAARPVGVAVVLVVVPFGLKGSATFGLLGAGGVVVVGSVGADCAACPLTDDGAPELTVEFGTSA